MALDKHLSVFVFTHKKQNDSPILIRHLLSTFLSSKMTSLKAVKVIWIFLLSSLIAQHFVQPVKSLRLKVGQFDPGPAYDIIGPMCSQYAELAIREFNDLNTIPGLQLDIQYAAPTVCASAPAVNSVNDYLGNFSDVTVFAIGLDCDEDAEVGGLLTSAKKLPVISPSVVDSNFLTTKYPTLIQIAPSQQSEMDGILDILQSLNLTKIAVISDTTPTQLANRGIITQSASNRGWPPVASVQIPNSLYDATPPIDIIRTFLLENDPVKVIVILADYSPVLGIVDALEQLDWMNADNGGKMLFENSYAGITNFAGSIGLFPPWAPLFNKTVGAYSIGIWSNHSSPAGVKAFQLFQKYFPTEAAAFVMAGGVHLQEGQWDDATRFGITTLVTMYEANKYKYGFGTIDPVTSLDQTTRLSDANLYALCMDHASFMATAYQVTIQGISGQIGINSLNLRNSAQFLIENNLGNGQGGIGSPKQQYWTTIGLIIGNETLTIPGAPQPIYLGGTTRVPVDFYEPYDADTKIGFFYLVDFGLVWGICSSVLVPVMFTFLLDGAIGSIIKRNSSTKEQQKKQLMSPRTWLLQNGISTAFGIWSNITAYTTMIAPVYQPAMTEMNPLVFLCMLIPLPFTFVAAHHLMLTGGSGENGSTASNASNVSAAGKLAGSSVGNGGSNVGLQSRQDEYKSGDVVVSVDQQLTTAAAIAMSGTVDGPSAKQSPRKVAIDATTTMITKVKISGNRVRVCQKKFASVIAGFCLSMGMMVTHIVTTKFILQNPYVQFDLSFGYVFLGFLTAWFLATIMCRGFVKTAKIWWSIWLILASPAYFFIASQATICIVKEMPTDQEASIAMSKLLSLTIVIVVAALILAFAFVLAFINMLLSSKWMSSLMTKAVDQKTKELAEKEHELHKVVKTSLRKDKVIDHHLKIQKLCELMAMTTEETEIANFPEIINWLAILKPATVTANPSNGINGAGISGVRERISARKSNTSPNSPKMAGVSIGTGISDFIVINVDNNVDEEKSLGEIDILLLLQNKIVRTHLGVFFTRSRSGENIEQLSMISDFSHANPSDRKVIGKRIMDVFVIPDGDDSKSNIGDTLRTEILKKYHNGGDSGFEKDKDYFEKVSNEIYTRLVSTQALTTGKNIERRHLLQNLYRATLAHEKLL